MILPFFHGQFLPHPSTIMTPSANLDSCYFVGRCRCLCFPCRLNLNAVSCVAACSLTHGDHLLRHWQNADVSASLAVSKCCLRLCPANYFFHQMTKTPVGPSSGCRIICIRSIILCINDPPHRQADTYTHTHTPSLSACIPLWRLSAGQRIIGSPLSHRSSCKLWVPLHLSTTVAFWESWPVFDLPLSNAPPGELLLKPLKSEYI